MLQQRLDLDKILLVKIQVETIYCATVFLWLGFKQHFRTTEEEKRRS